MFKKFGGIFLAVGGKCWMTVTVIVGIRSKIAMKNACDNERLF